MVITNWIYPYPYPIVIGCPFLGVRCLVWVALSGEGPGGPGPIWARPIWARMGRAHMGPSHMGLGPCNFEYHIYHILNLFYFENPVFFRIYEVRDSPLGADYTGMGGYYQLEVHPAPGSVIAGSSGIGD